MSDRLYFSVPDECDNMLAQRFLRDKCGLSARIITRLKREKDGILMDGKILRTIDCVQSGKTVSIAIPDEKCEIEPTKGTLDIRYEDEHFLVVNKPHSMPVHPVKQHQSDTLANIVSYYCSQNGKPFVFRAINRLDKDTSGLVLIAKNRFTANAVKNKTHKVYYALCEGEINTEGVVSQWICVMIPKWCELSVMTEWKQLRITNRLLQQKILHCLNCGLKPAEHIKFGVIWLI